jgi:hypothetical protein
VDFLMVIAKNCTLLLVSEKGKFMQRRPQKSSHYIPARADIRVDYVP